MASDIVDLPVPPRKVLPAGAGAMMLELEAEIVVIRKENTIIKKVCAVERKGERLLWPVGLTGCATLAPKGAINIYEDGLVLHRLAGIFAEDDELVDTLSAGTDRIAVLVGRMTGDPLRLPTPEYRFAVLTNAGQLLAKPPLLMKRKPVAWGVLSGGSRLFVLLSEAGSSKLLLVPTAQETVPELSWPAEWAKRRVTGMALRPVGDDLLLSVEEDKGTKLVRVEKPASASPSYRTLAASIEPIDQPAWSPDGNSLSYRQADQQARSLKVLTIGVGIPQTICSLQESDETLWLDSTTIAVVRWDKVERLSLLKQ